MKSKFSIKFQSYLALFFIIAGGVCGFIQNTYYGYVDEEGILHDSLFLPFGVICFIIGASLTILTILRFLFSKRL
jgi:hypothetical protein